MADLDIELAVCISSAAKRGVSQKSNSLADGFELVGLGQLISAIEASDRYIEVF